MKPFFFGSGEKRLFGVYHPPSIESVSSQSIVLCPPVGHEYLHTYRLLRKLAEQLQKLGHHVLRFDLSGTGDSSGTHVEGCATLWMSDIIDAVTELLSRSGHSNVSLIGFSFGATLAWSVADKLPLIEHLTLWRPICNGPQWLEQLPVEPSSQSSGSQNSDNSDREIFGFLYSRDCFEEIQQIDLSVRPLPNHGKIHLIYYQSGNCTTLIQRLKNSGRCGIITPVTLHPKHPENRLIIDQIILASPALHLIADIFNRKSP